MPEPDLAMLSVAVRTLAELAPREADGLAHGPASTDAGRAIEVCHRVDGLSMVRRSIGTAGRKTSAVPDRGGPTVAQ